MAEFSSDNVSAEIESGQESEPYREPVSDSSFPISNSNQPAEDELDQVIDPKDEENVQQIGVEASSNTDVEPWVRKRRETIYHNILLEIQSRKKAKVLKDTPEQDNLENPESHEKDENPESLEKDEIPESHEKDENAESLTYDPGKYDKFVNVCCHSYSFGLCTELFCHCRRGGKLERAEIIPNTPEVKIAQSLGWDEVKKSLSNFFTDTPIGDTVREVSIYGGFLWTLLFFLISISGLIIDKGKSLSSIFGVAFGSLVLCFTIFDAIYYGYHRRCTTCNKWKEWYKKKKNASKNETNNKMNDETIEETDNETNKERNDETNSELPDSDACCYEKCTCLGEKFTKAIDIIRIVINELLYYPGVILSVFDFATQLVDNNNDATKISVSVWLLTIISFLGDFATVYAIRAFILAGSLFTMINILNFKNIGRALFHFIFILFAYGIMTQQICMIISITVRYYFEYSVAAEMASRLNSTDVNYQLSGSLWYMLICCFFTPIVGVIVFFAVHHYWTQKFPCDFLFTFLEHLKSAGFLTFRKELEEKSKKIEKFLNVDKMKERFNEIPFKAKLLYPFKSPQIIVLCFVYNYLLSFFYVLSISGTSTSYGWSVFFFVTYCFSCLVNLYAFCIATLWNIILAMILALIVLFLMFYCCARPSSSRPR